MCTWICGKENDEGYLEMRKDKIRILHIAQAAGGVDRYIRMLLKYLDKEKFENILVCSQDFREEDYKNLVDFFEQVKMDRAIGSNDLKAIGEVRRLIKRYNPDIVYGDDWLELDYVEYLMNLIHQTGAEMAMTDKIFTTRDREQTKKDAVEVWTPEDAFCGIIYPKFPIGPWNKIYKASLLKEHHIDFNRPWSGEGLYFSSMAVQCANKVAVGHRKIYNYRLNNTNSGLTHYNLKMGTNAISMAAT